MLPVIRSGKNVSLPAMHLFLPQPDHATRHTIWGMPEDGSVRLSGLGLQARQAALLLVRAALALRSRRGCLLRCLARLAHLREHKHT